MIKSLYTFISDLHEGAPNELQGYAYPYQPQNDKEYYVGDNIDMTNCKKSKVKFYQDKLNKLKQFYGDRLITGNHEAQRDTDRLVIIKPGIAVMHGDDIFWGRNKSAEYRQKDHGAGFLKRGLWVNALEAIEQGYDRKVSDQDLNRFSAICDTFGVHTIIVGHLHPTKQLDIDHNGKKLIVLKRGITTLAL